MHPVVAAWFAETYGEPTDIQRRVWPVIARGEHVLFTAPTGSGKTLAAFLYSLDRLLTGEWEAGRTTVLYVSPLKALNNDIQRNLLQPLTELTARLRAAGHDPPRIRALTRSGDTPAEERRGMLRHPPEILITTPESLNILLTSKSGRTLLETVQKVILDEIHAVAGGKRGTHLITAVERVDRLAELPVQRIAISATVRPLEEIAQFVAGCGPGGVSDTAGGGTSEDRGGLPPAAEAAPSGGAPPGGAGPSTLRPDPRRPITVVTGEGHRDPELRVEYADPLQQVVEEEPSPWLPVIEILRSHLGRNRSTLIFTTNRRDAEKVASLLNEAEGRLCAYPHHGSLSLELRRRVESQMKEGALEAIVATTSLELGIDIGSIDEVILLRTPYTVASAVQMVGRSGHRVDAVSRGTFVPFFPRDLLSALVMREAVAEQDIEEITPVEGALDVLAQLIVSMTAHEEWELEELYEFLRGTYPYRALDRRLFEGVVDMLAGRYADSHIRELESRIFKDDLAGTIRGRPGVERVIYHSGGTIPDRGYYELRVAGSESKLGELDEEFVWERRLGEVFVFGNQKWKIREITDRSVRVEPAADASRALPFWRGEPLHRGYHWSRRLLDVLTRLEEILSGADADALNRPALRAEVRAALAPGAGTDPAARGGPTAGRAGDSAGAHSDAPSISDDALDHLIDFLQEQRDATDGLPHRGRIVVEETAGRHDRDTGTRDVVVHTLWGGRLNYPLALLLRRVLEASGTADTPGDGDGSPEVAVYADDDAVLVQLPSDRGANEVAAALREVASRPEQIHEALRDILERSGFFAARFRENAGRALLLPRAGFDRRTPLWLNRLRARNILAVVSQYPDFPIVVETWRTCLRDYFDLPNLTERLRELHGRDISVAAVATTNPSPFARELVWQQTNVNMYELDRGVGRSSVTSELIRSVAASGILNRTIPAEVISETDRRLKRQEAYYAPEPGDDLIAWVRGRVVIPEEEWTALVEAVAAGAGDSRAGADGPTGRDDAGADAVVASVAHRVCRLTLPGAARAVVTTIDRLPTLEAALRHAGGALQAPGDAGRNADDDTGDADAHSDGRRRLGDLAEALAPGTSIRAEVTRAYELTESGAPADPARKSSREPEPEGLLRDFLGYYASISPGEIAGTFGVPEEWVDAFLEEARESGEAVAGHDPREPSRVCRSDIYEILLRRTRRRGRQAIRPVTAERLPLFSAVWHGLIRDDASAQQRERHGAEVPARSRRVEGAVEQLSLLPVAPDTLEELILPARIRDYRPADLDDLTRRDEVLWFGNRSGRIVLTIPEDRDLAASLPSEEGAEAPEGGSLRDGEPSEAGEPAEALFPATRGRFAFWDLHDHAGLGIEETARRLLELVWAGEVSADTLGPIRSLPERGARRPENSGAESRHGAGVRSGRRHRSQRRQVTPAAGAYWYRLAAPPSPESELEALERAKDRARVLLDRHGIVFRERLRDEAPGLRWRDVSNALRLMELAGEVLGGYFLEGGSGLQFATPEAAELLRNLEAAPSVYWMSAADPASPAGVGMTGLPYELPARQKTTLLVFRGTDLAVVARRGGKDVDIDSGIDEDDPDLLRLFEFARTATSRAVRPLSRFVIETINGGPASASPYASALREMGFRPDHTRLVLWARYR